MGGGHESSNLTESLMVIALTRQVGEVFGSHHTGRSKM